MNGSTSYRTITDHLPQKLRDMLLSLNEGLLHGLMEVRLRSGGPVYFVYPERILFLGRNSELRSDSRELYIVSAAEIKAILDRLCHFSVHSCPSQLSQGWFVIGNGVRVGLAGMYSSTSQPVLTDLSSLNFRISREVRGCADGLFPQIYDKNVIICGGVGSGKTSILRELCRLNGSLRKTALIDERNEISCFCDGAPRYDVGLMTDILVNCTRSFGISSAVRTMSPELIICDEIASSEDTEAIVSGIACGVRFIVTAHGENMQEACKRPELRYLTESGLFHRIVFLKGASRPGETGEIIRL